MQLFIPIITAALTALTTFSTMFIRDILVQNKREKRHLLKERLEKCYTPIYLSLKSKNKIEPGFLEANIAIIVVSYGHLLSMELLNTYIELLEVERPTKEINDLYKHENEKADSDVPNREQKMKFIHETIYSKYLNLMGNYTEKFTAFEMKVELEYKTLKNEYFN